MKPEVRWQKIQKIQKIQKTEVFLQWTTIFIILISILISVSGCRDRTESTFSSKERRHIASYLSSVPNIPKEGVLFVDVASEAGINFTHSFGDAHFSNLIEAVGGGAAFFDYNQDGYLDLYLTTGKFNASINKINKGEKPDVVLKNRLYRNRGDGSFEFEFEDVTDKAKVGCEGLFSMGVAIADYNNDGYPDLYVCNYGRSVLFKNRGGRNFENVTRKAGVGNERGCAVTATWLDYDKDGLLDLYVGNYIEFDPKYNLFYAPDGFPGPLAYAGQADRLYKNKGDGSFEDVSHKVGLAKFKGRAMSAAAADYDGDGYDDIYVTNDAMENFLLKNENGKRFVEVASKSGVAFNAIGDSASSMGIDFGDYNNDGKLDLFVSDSSINSLFQNDGEGVFRDVTIEAGIASDSAQFVGWGSFFFDYDSDGDLDLFKVNADLSRLFGQEDQLFENMGDGMFEDVSDKMGAYFQKELLGRGACFGDYDNDGDLDIVVVNINNPAVLLRNMRNNGGNKNNWISLKLLGRPPLSNKDAVGAKVKLTSGSLTQVAEKKSASGYLSQNDPRLHFGLGHSRIIDRLEIVWPSGKRQLLQNIAANQILTVEEPLN